MINEPLINTGTQKGVQSSTYMYKYLTEKCLGKFLKNYNVLNHVVTDTKDYNYFIIINQKLILLKRTTKKYFINS